MADAAWAILRMPPITTAKTSAARTTPVTNLGTPIRLKAEDTSKACTPLPMPKPASIPKRANRPAIQLQREPRPLRM